MSLQSGNACDEREVFISYRRLDDIVPDDHRSRYGFVNYLLRQVRARLQEEGVPGALLWQDRSKIEPGDVWSDAIKNALNRAELFVAILSRNYITSPWCKQELDTMKSRVEMLGPPAGTRRIFRVDKHKVPESTVPDALRGIQSVRFYREDNDAKCIDEFFWGGKVRLSREYDKALLELTSAISRRLEELGIPSEPDRQPEPEVDHACPSNGRVVFVAKPAGDMDESYRTLVEELRGRGFRITPDPDEALGTRGEQVRCAVLNALAEAESSIHLLGTRKGMRPDGLDMDLVPMQLAAAADEVKRRPTFERMIWAPTVLPAETSAQAKRPRSDPLKILKRFGQRLLATDQIHNDTASHFNEFVLQHLSRKHEVLGACIASRQAGSGWPAASHDWRLH
jgi:hypothetical protein